MMIYEAMFIIREWMIETLTRIDEEEKLQTKR